MSPLDDYLGDSRYLEYIIELLEKILARLESIDAGINKSE